ncbi:hypothetical protein ACJX0J_030261, partial [Zea mays]
GIDLLEFLTKGLKNVTAQGVLYAQSAHCETKTTGVVGFPEFLKSVTSIDCRFWYIDCVGGQLMTIPVFMYNPIAVGLLMNAAIFQAADIMHKDKRDWRHIIISIQSTAIADSQASGLPFLLVPTSMEYFLLFELGKITDSVIVVWHSYETSGREYQFIFTLCLPQFMHPSFFS